MLKSLLGFNLPFNFAFSFFSFCLLLELDLNYQLQMYLQNGEQCVKIDRSMFHLHRVYDMGCMTLQK